MAQEGSVDGAEQGRWGSREIELSNVRLLNRVGDQHQLFHSDDFMRVAFNYAVHQQMDDVVFGVAINRIDGLVMHGTNTEIERQTLPNLKGSGEVYIDIERLGLQDGTYTLDVAVHRADGYPYDYHRAAVKFAVRWPLNQVGVLVPQLSWQVNADGY